VIDREWLREDAGNNDLPKHNNATIEQKGYRPQTRNWTTFVQYKCMSFQ
jgi:hypothetical protein